MIFFYNLFSTLCFCCCSVTKSHWTLCDSSSTPGFSVPHYLLKFNALAWQLYISWKMMQCARTSLVALMVGSLPAMWETQVRSPG